MKGVIRLRIRLVVCSQQLMLRICKQLQLGEAKPNPIGQQRKESSKASTAINFFITAAVYLLILRYSIKLFCVFITVFFAPTRKPSARNGIVIDPLFKPAVKSGTHECVPRTATAIHCGPITRTVAVTG